MRAKAIKSATNSTLNKNETNVQPQHRVILSQQILEYIRSLEDRIKQLETEKARKINNESTYENTSVLNSKSNPALDNDEHNRNHQPGSVPMCPQPLLVAMQALKIQEDLGTTENPKSSTTNFTPNINNNVNCSTTTIENNNRTNPNTISDNTNEVITDQHKAIVKGLCNVIWRKIEDSS